MAYKYFILLIFKTLMINIYEDIVPYVTSTFNITWKNFKGLSH